MSAITVGAIGVLAVIVLIFLNVPVALVLILVGFSGFAYLTSLEAALMQLPSGAIGWLASYTWVVVPLFILMGTIVANSVLSGKIYGTSQILVGQYRGGLGIATIMGCALFGAVCGSSTAASATMCKIAYPQMSKLNYKQELSAGIIATGGTLAILIPPSLGFVIYASITEASLGKLFLAGIIPGIIHSCLYTTVIIVWTWIDPTAGPSGPAVSIRQKLASLGGIVEIMILFFLVMGGLFLGWFPPSEAAAIGATGAIIAALARRGLSWRQFMQSLGETMRATAMITLLMVGAVTFGSFIAASRLPYELAGWITSLNVPPIIVLAVILLSYLVIGCIMEFISALVITVPIYLPLLESFGWDPVWFGVMIVLMIEVALVTPPMGLNVWVTGGMLPQVPMSKIFKGVLIFCIADLTLVAILMFVPQIALFIPSLMK